MKYWLDTEYQDDGQQLHLLSVGLVAEDGREFYAISSDFPIDRASSWHRANTLPLLDPPASSAWANSKEIAERLRAFIGVDAPEFWTMCSPWDWLGVVRLFGRVEDLPHGWPMIAFDLWQLEHHASCQCRPPHPGPEHHALVDARWHRQVYEHLVKAHPLKT